MLKRHILIKLGLISLIGITLFSNSFAKNDQNLKDLQEKIKKIDFSKEPNEEEKAIIMEYYKLSSNDNEHLSDYFAKRDSLDFEKDRLSSDLFLAKLKEYSPNNFVIQDFKSTSALGSVGDILVTYSSSSFEKNIDASKYAAIVHENAKYTIEAYPESGVKVYSNDWANKSKVYGIRVTGASINDYKNAAKDALNQTNKALNFFNKETTDSFYYSQLVWKAWKNQGFDIDSKNFGIFAHLSSTEPHKGAYTYVFYQKD